jgi:hypothetical protein
MSKIIPRDDIPFIPLKLPKDGEDLIPGRQYEIDSVARAVIFNHFGIVTPKFVECIRSKLPARKVTISVEYADGRPSKTTSYEEPPQEATFRAFYKYKRIANFTLDLTVVEFQRQFYQDAPLEVEEDEDETPKKKSTKEKKERPIKMAISTDELLKL